MGTQLVPQTHGVLWQNINIPLELPPPLTSRFLMTPPIPVLLPRKSHGWRSLEGCSPWGRWRSDTTEWLHFHFLLLCIGEGNGNPLQCSCLENPRDGGAWWAAVYGVAQSRTRLKWLSSSSNDIQGSKTKSKCQVTGKVLSFFLFFTFGVKSTFTCPEDLCQAS